MTPTDAECDRMIPILFHGLTYRVPPGQSFDQAARDERRKAIRAAWATVQREPTP